MAEEKPYHYQKEEKRNTILAIGVLLILIIVIGGALIYVISQKPSPPPVTNNQTSPPVTVVNETNMTNTTPTCDDSCLYSNAIANQNFSECQLISSQSQKETCYEQLSNVSIDACKMVTDQNKLSTCITAFAVSQKNISLCDTLTQGKSACQFAVNPCVNVTNMNLCGAIHDSNPSECLSDSNCLLNYSIQTKNISSCGLIQDPVTSAACSSSVSYTDHCNTLSLQGQRDLCYNLFATYTNNYLECTQITPGTSYALNCITSFAISMKNDSLCNNLQLNDKWSCLINYSLMTGDLTGCSNIDPLASSNLFQCVFNYAIKYGDPSACEVIDQSLAIRSTCYQGTIIYQNQNLKWQNCAGVSNFQWQNACYTAAAKIDNDISICNYESPAYAVQSCQSSYASNKTSG